MQWETELQKGIRVADRRAKSSGLSTLEKELQTFQRPVAGRPSPVRSGRRHWPGTNGQLSPVARPVGKGTAKDFQRPIDRQPSPLATLVVIGSGPVATRPVTFSRVKRKKPNELPPFAPFPTYLHMCVYVFGWGPFLPKIFK
jgi:hypothetical protein